MPAWLIFALVAAATGVWAYIATRKAIKNGKERDKEKALKEGMKKRLLDMANAMETDRELESRGENLDKKIKGASNNEKVSALRNDLSDDLRELLHDD